MLTPQLPWPDDNPLDRLLEALRRFISEIPTTHEPESESPEKRAREIASKACITAATVSGTLALPPGPIGYVTIIPDLIGIWKLQAQMVADIAGAFGKQAYLAREQMLYCLFKHAAAQAVRDLVVRMGERVLIRKPALSIIQAILRRVGIRITQRLAGAAIARWLPVIGAVGVGAYAYYDTGQVAATAIDLFRREIDIEASPPDA